MWCAKTTYCHSLHKVFRKRTPCKQATTAQSMLEDLTLGEFVKEFSNFYETLRYINVFRVPATRPCIKLAELSWHSSYFSNITLNKILSSIYVCPYQFPLLKDNVRQDMTTCILTEIIEQCEGMCCLHLQGIYLYISSTNFSAPETTKRRDLTRIISFIITHTHHIEYNAIKRQGYVFRPSMVIFRPYWELVQGLIKDISCALGSHALTFHLFVVTSAAGDELPNFILAYFGITFFNRHCLLK
jgi:hypothetical protein